MRSRRRVWPCPAPGLAAVALWAVLAVPAPALAQSPSRPAAEAPAPRERYEGHRVVEVLIRDAADLSAMEAISPDMWSHHVSPGEWAAFRIPPERVGALEASGLEFRTLVTDLAPLIEAERTGANVRGASWFDDYHDLTDIQARIDELVALRPDLATRFIVGTSHEARQIFGVSVTGPGAEPRPAVCFTGCQHAREWISPAVVMYILDSLINGYDTDPEIQRLVDSVEWILVPIVNVDGYQYSWGPERLWRKNRRNNGGSFGVDLNRNWDFGWGLSSGSSGSPDSDTYRGPAPFSEPETSAVRDLFLANPSIRAHIDFHSYSQLVLSPWGHTTDPAPDAPLLDGLASQMEAIIESTYGTPYVSGPGGATLYLASGIIPDWSYGARGALAWTIELRPGPNNGSSGFILPADQIIPTCEETFPAAAFLADYISRPVILSLSGEQPLLALPGEITPLAFTITPGYQETLDAASPTLHRRLAGAGAFQSAPLTNVSGDIYSGELPPAPCGNTWEWYATASTLSAATASLPDAGAAGPIETRVGVLEPLFADNAETDMGWSLGVPGDTASTGVWVRTAPNGSTAQPGADNPAGTGTLCFLTGADPPGAQPGTNDVDGGATTLRSPMLDATAGECFIRYYRWYSNNAGSNPNSDTMPVEISSDGGASWVLLEEVDENANQWVFRTFRVADYVAPTSQVMVRFVARDLLAGSIIEVGVDDFALVFVSCVEGPSADLNGDCVVDSADLGLLLEAYGGAGAGLLPDLNDDGVVDTADLGLLIGAFGDACE